jgi:hypothetical protein
MVYLGILYVRFVFDREEEGDVGKGEEDEKDQLVGCINDMGEEDGR